MDGQASDTFRYLACLCRHALPRLTPERRLIFSGADKESQSILFRWWPSHWFIERVPGFSMPVDDILLCVYLDQGLVRRLTKGLKLSHKSLFLDLDTETDYYLRPM